MTRKARAQLIVIVCLRYFEVENWEYLSSIRTAKVALCRHCIWTLLMEEFDLSSYQLGQKLCVEHSSIDYCLRPERVAVLAPFLEELRGLLSDKLEVKKIA